jgi:hypothetical protein
MWLWDAGQPRDEGCPSCSAWADHIARGHLAHLHARSTTLALVSRAPLAKIDAFKKRMGWTLPWYSSFGGDFNYDFRVVVDESVAPLQYNYQSKAEHEKAGTAYYFEGEQPFDRRTSCFIRDGNESSTLIPPSPRRGTVGGSYYFLGDRAGPSGGIEEPKGRARTRRPLAVTKSSPRSIRRGGGRQGPGEHARPGVARRPRRAPRGEQT